MSYKDRFGPGTPCTELVVYELMSPEYSTAPFGSFGVIEADGGPRDGEDCCFVRWFDGSLGPGGNSGPIFVKDLSVAGRMLIPNDWLVKYNDN